MTHPLLQCTLIAAVCITITLVSATPPSALPHTLRARLIARHLRLRSVFRYNNIGLAYDTCSKELPCAGGLTCRNGDSPCPSSSSDCVCVPDNPNARICTTSTDCRSGERCVRPKFEEGDSSAQLICASCFAWHFNMPDPHKTVDIEPSSCLIKKPYRGGYTGDACGSIDPSLAPCVAPRVCVHNIIGNKQPLCEPGQADCVCRSSPKDQRCMKSSECPEGERCVNGFMDIHCNGCRSSAIDTVIHSPRDDDDSHCKLEMSPVAASTTSAPPTAALSESTTAENPTVTVTEKPPKVEEPLPEPSGEETDETPLATPEELLIAPMSPSMSGERSPGLNSTTSPSPSPTALVNGVSSGTTASATGGESSDSCIAAKHLSELATGDELVFRTHRVARVLCDAHGSCATPGHIVEVMTIPQRGAMTMRKYCESRAVGGCSQREMQVNSPRWRRGRRVRSQTEGLKFTALAARWETLAEERVLSTLAGFGA